MTPSQVADLMRLRHVMGMQARMAQYAMDREADRPNTDLYKDAKRKATELIRMKAALEQMMSEMGIE